MPQGWCDANLDSFCAHRRQRCAGRDEETDSEIHSEGTRCATLANSLTKKAPYKGRSADSEEKREPVSDIDTEVVGSLKVLDPNRPIREAAMDSGQRMPPVDQNEHPPGGELSTSNPRSIVRRGMLQSGALLVSRTRSSHGFSAGIFANFGSKGTLESLESWCRFG